MVALEFVERNESVPLNIDSRKALETDAQLRDLVAAIVGATPEEEHDALEWKSNFPDLADRAAAFAIAKTILGFANRDVRVAQTHFEGQGFLVVGAEPGRVCGQVVPDSAQLQQSISRYTGSVSPDWRTKLLEVEGSVVLVVIVPSPKEGDRIALLRKSFQPRKGSLVEEGTVYVRKAGKTERAGWEDLERLQERLLAGRSEDRTAREDRSERVKQLVTDYALAAENWVGTMETWIIASAGAAWSRHAITDLINTDSGRKLGIDMEKTRACYKQIRLRTSDRKLLDALEIAQRLLCTSEVFDPIWNANGPSEGRERSVAYRHLNSVRRAIIELEEKAIDSLVAK